MLTPVRLLTALRYTPDGRSEAPLTVASPSWDAVVDAITRMDGYCYPVVQLSCTGEEEDEASLNVVGGDSRFALFEFCPGWQYSDSSGGDAPVHVWRSDQGYLCAERNVLTDLEKVLRIVRAYYGTGSYDGLDAVV